MVIKMFGLPPGSGTKTSLSDDAVTVAYSFWIMRVLARLIPAHNVPKNNAYAPDFKHLSDEWEK